MSDAQSLTLPKPGALTRVRRRKRRRPPNWKWILWGMLWDGLWLIVWLIDFATKDRPLIDLLAAIVFGLDLTVQIRRWTRPDGGYRWEDRWHIVLSIGLYICLFGSRVAGVW